MIARSSLRFDADVPVGAMRTTIIVCAGTIIALLRPFFGDQQHLTSSPNHCCRSGHVIEWLGPIPSRASTVSINFIPTGATQGCLLHLLFFRGRRRQTAAGVTSGIFLVSLHECVQADKPTSHSHRKSTTWTEQVCYGAVTAKKKHATNTLQAHRNFLETQVYLQFEGIGVSVQC
jgi:hypothetical protein